MMSFQMELNQDYCMMTKSRLFRVSDVFIYKGKSIQCDGTCHVNILLVQNLDQDIRGEIIVAKQHAFLWN